MAKYKHVRSDGIVKSEHRSIWEKAHGVIPDGYEIHHKNGNGRDNRLENLVLLTKREHRQLHAKMRVAGIDPVDVNDPNVVANCARLKRYRELHKDEISEKQKIRYAKNRDAIRAQQKLYNDTHKQERRARYESDRSRILARDKAYQQAHKAEIAEQRRKFRESHKELISLRNRLDYAIRSGKPSDVIDQLRKAYDAINVNGRRRQ